MEAINHFSPDQNDVFLTMVIMTATNTIPLMAIVKILTDFFLFEGKNGKTNEASISINAKNIDPMVSSIHEDKKKRHSANLAFPDPARNDGTGISIRSIS